MTYRMYDPSPSNPLRSVPITDFQELVFTAERLATEAQELVERLKDEFDASSDAGDVNACLALKLSNIQEEVEHIKEVRNDELRW